MNILIPDKWLREYLKTDATPKQLKEYLSLCGPSIERINEIDGAIVYDVEITTNRPDSMSVVGIAREAAAILPRFGVPAKLLNDPYSLKTDLIVKSFVKLYDNTSTGSISTTKKPLNIKTDPKLNPRWTSIVLQNVSIKPSPQWLQDFLTLTGIRPINNIVDITNYLMRAFGQPAHAFDYGEIKPNKKGIPTMILRAAKKGEKIITLDEKEHSLPGEDIIIEDGSRRLIDLCGIMGAKNSSITEKTTSIVLFMQTYKAEQIRKTSMALAHRTEAAQLFEKGIDSELVLPTIIKGIELVKELSGGEVANKIYDLYPKPYTPYEVTVQKSKLNTYVGDILSDSEIKNILAPLGFKTKMTQQGLTVSVPSFRRDVEIDVDIIEEVARIYGYHNIQNKLPDTQPPVVIPDRTLTWEKEIKIKLRDWGYTETYTYSMISEALMDIFNIDKSQTYKIANPLSSEWEYMRPNLLPSLLQTIEYNLHFRRDFQLFELSMIYEYRKNDLPNERPILAVAWTEEKFYEAKGLAESLFATFGISPTTNTIIENPYFHPSKSIQFEGYGSLGLIHPKLLTQLKIKTPITILELDFENLVKNTKSTKVYNPIPKFPTIIEDLTFVFPQRTQLGSILNAIKSISPFVYSVTITSQYESNTTFTIEYLNTEKALNSEEVQSLRKEIIEKVTQEFQGQLR